MVFLIELVTEYYSGDGSLSKIQVGYIQDETKAKHYCEVHTKALKGTYNEQMGCKYFQARKMNSLD